MNKITVICENSVHGVLLFAGEHVPVLPVDGDSATPSDTGSGVACGLVAEF